MLLFPADNAAVVLPAIRNERSCWAIVSPKKSFRRATPKGGHAGAGEIVDPRPYVSGEMKNTCETYPKICVLLPGMGYSNKQIKDLEATVNRVPCDVVIIGTPIDLSRIITITKPALRVMYDLQEIGEPSLQTVLKEHFKKINGVWYQAQTQAGVAQCAPAGWKSCLSALRSFCFPRSSLPKRRHGKRLMPSTGTFYSSSVNLGVHKIFSTSNFVDYMLVTMRVYVRENNLESELYLSDL